jgi:hypothetical protein
MRTLDRVLAFVCAVTAVFALSFAVGRIAGPVGSGDPPDPPAPTQEHDPGGSGEH